MNVQLDGEKISNESDFHKFLARALGVQEFYGENNDALWDFLSASIERPICIKWKNSEISKAKMGASFEKIITVFERVKQQDKKFGWEEKFTYCLD